MSHGEPFLLRDSGVAGSRGFSPTALIFSFDCPVEEKHTVNFHFIRTGYTAVTPNTWTLTFKVATGAVTATNQFKWYSIIILWKCLLKLYNRVLFSDTIIPYITAVTYSQWHTVIAFMCSAPSAWNTLQNVLKVKELILLNAFKSKMKKLGGRFSLLMFLNLLGCATVL